MRARDKLLERFPDYEYRVARHVGRGAVMPFRFAVTAALLRRSKLPVILMVTHGLGGGVRRHIDTLVERCRGQARVLLVESTQRGPALAIPELPNHPPLPFPADREDDIALLLRDMNVGRVHVHHLMGIDLDVRRLIERLGVPFDTTVHDYYTLCPQINLLPWRHNSYCNEPDIGDCNACIARSHHWARDIMTWRAEHAWVFHDADRVLCPTQDVVNRLKRYRLDEHAVFAPHEPVPAKPWPLRLTAPGHDKLRIAVLGTLADHKGGRTVAAVAEMMDPERFELHLIGHIDGALSKPALDRMEVTGSYDGRDLPMLIAQAAPHVIWFPMVWPETFSYTLSAAISAGSAIAATRIGAFPERLAGRPFAWLADIATTPAGWIALFDEIRGELEGGHKGKVPSRTRQPDFYPHQYLATPAVNRLPRHSRPRIVILPERFDIGLPTPCAYVRLLQPLFHPAVAEGFDVVIADSDTVTREPADIIVSQRFAPPDQRAADQLIGHARKTGAALVYDLDDDLLHIPKNHPDARTLRPQAKVARSMLLAADTVWASTAALAASIAPLHAGVRVIENRLDERIWANEPAPTKPWNGAIRILCMGTTSHTEDFGLIEPALTRLKETYGDRVVIDVLGMTNKDTLPKGLNRIGPTPHASRSYAGFVQWLTSIRPSWHIGLAPLIDSPFSRCKSPIKALDYAALGLVVLASDTPVYRGSIADGPAGQLVANDPAAWFGALDWLVRNRDLRQSIGERARDAFLRDGTLAGQASVRRDALQRCLNLRPAETAA